MNESGKENIVRFGHRWMIYLAATALTETHSTPQTPAVGTKVVGSPGARGASKPQFLFLNVSLLACRQQQYRIFTNAFGSSPFRLFLSKNTKK